MSAGHSVLPPSGAAAWRHCAMWPTMNQQFPQGDTPETLEGNAAHWVAWEMLAGRPIAEGDVAPNGAIVTAEMLDGGELLVDTIRTRTGAGCTGWHIEERVGISVIHPECWGTPDAWAYMRDAGVLEVIDYKFGHRFVDEFENEQGVAYIAGIIDVLANWLGMGPGWLDQRLTVNFTIVQPRCFYRGAPVRTWTARTSDLRGLVNALTAAAAAALAPNPTATTNPECRNCPGRIACPALQKGAYADAEYAVQSTPVQLPAAAASLELRMLERALERLESRVDGLREVVAAYAKQGQPVPFHRLEQTEGRRIWNIPAPQVVAMGQLMGVDLAKPATLTPSQAKSAGIDESVIKAYSTTQPGKIKLVPDNPADARRVFGTFKQE